MKKLLFKATLGLMGMMGTLAIGVVNASNYVTIVPGLVVTGEQDGQVFEYGVLKFDDGSGHIIMLLDRNLGATMTGAGAEANTGSYGFKYQWGNNYGFADGCWTNGCSDSVTENATSIKAIWKPDYDNSNYFGNTFIIGDDAHGRDYWSDSRSNSGNHVNLWGGGNDTQSNNWGIDTMTVENIMNRQGPCPVGYHVPSIGEWNNLIVYWYNAKKGESLSTTSLLSKSETNLGKDLAEMFYIPFAGQRFGLMIDNSFLSPATMNSSFVFLQSSSPFKNPDSSSHLSHFVHIMYGAVSNIYEAPRGNAGPVRCFSNDYLFPEYSVVFYDGDTEITSGTVKEYNTRSGSIPSMSKDGYEFLYWYLSGVDSEFNFTGTTITGDLELYAKWTPITYSIEFTGTDVEGTMENQTFTYDVAQNLTANTFTKDGYQFSGWTDGITGYTDGQEVINLTITSGDVITLTAEWTKIETKPSGGSSGGGGRSNKTSNDDEKSTEIQTGNQEPLGPSDSSPDREQTVTPLIGGDGEARGGGTSTYSDEFQQAYNFAHEKGITTMDTIDKANMNGKLTRIAMAKMLSQYAINVLGQKPVNIIVPKFSDITEKLDADYDNGVTLAYQLGIMGINMPDNKFRSNDEVTRAEFATALSRMLYSTPDGKPYYTTHLEKLKEEGILKNDDYKMKELRGYVMIMLMRSAK